MKRIWNLIERLYDIIEKNLTLLGGTAVENISYCKRHYKRSSVS